jgi:hypothetical protein
VAHIGDMGDMEAHPMDEDSPIGMGVVICETCGRTFKGFAEKNAHRRRGKLCLRLQARGVSIVESVRDLRFRAQSAAARRGRLADEGK